MTPFILKGAIPIPSEAVLLTEHLYDSQQQLWINSRTGVPLILSDMPADTSTYGETTTTRAAREGTDQINLVHASIYGETTLTKTCEGTDQSEITAFMTFQHNEAPKTPIA